MRTSFYTYFSSGYGTLWLAALFLSFLGDEPADTAEIGLFGFPIIALIYAICRRALDRPKPSLQHMKQPAPSD